MSGTLASIATGCGTCDTARYLVQAGRGQLALFNRTRPIPDVIEDSRTPPRVRRLLAEIPAIKRFGETAGLKATSNYEDYVALDRKAAVWVVSACDPLKFESKEWGFPIVGRFPYLGWFDLDDARRFASELKTQNLDVDLRGASAYSTLGWFKDPVLSTMIPEGGEAEGWLVNVVLHESVHATYYLNGQAFLNESVANFVADKLTPRYFDQARGPASPALVAWKDAEVSHEERGQKMRAAYAALAALYASDRPDADKLARKGEILRKLMADLGAKRELNNASLIQFKTYNTGEEEFESLYQACGGELGRFWGTLRTLDGASFGRSQARAIGPVIAKLAGLGCPQQSGKGGGS